MVVVGSIVVGVATSVIVLATSLGPLGPGLAIALGAAAKLTASAQTAIAVRAFA